MDIYIRITFMEIDCVMNIWASLAACHSSLDSYSYMLYYLYLTDYFPSWHKVWQLFMCILSQTKPYIAKISFETKLGICNFNS
jgi:hypothetical protein